MARRVATRLEARPDVPWRIYAMFWASAFGALLLGKFCLGAYVYHLLRGNVAFANGTCPWSD